MGKSKQARAHEFTEKARKEIYARDFGQCIFCIKKYNMQGSTRYSQQILSVMHYIPRSAGGLGIPQNGAIGCQFHHNMLDNGNQGNRKEMLEIFRQYLQELYPEWNEDELVYRKW